MLLISWCDHDSKEIVGWIWALCIYGPKWEGRLLLVQKGQREQTFQITAKVESEEKVSVWEKTQTAFGLGPTKAHQCSKRSASTLISGLPKHPSSQETNLTKAIPGQTTPFFQEEDLKQAINIFNQVCKHRLQHHS